MIHTTTLQDRCQSLTGRENRDMRSLSNLTRVPGLQEMRLRRKPRNPDNRTFAFKESVLPHCGGAKPQRREIVPQ